mmetsp:Transcript_93044/g.252388  ORF Transcript_93044/g.252388 Transcript_93044/m.252388 type:complete len:366 (+) Transcript_93044:45-1142(+)
MVPRGPLRRRATPARSRPHREAERHPERRGPRRPARAASEGAQDVLIRVPREQLPHPLRQRRLPLASAAPASHVPEALHAHGVRHAPLAGGRGLDFGGVYEGYLRQRPRLFHDAAGDQDRGVGGHLHLPEVPPVREAELAQLRGPVVAAVRAVLPLDDVAQDPPEDHGVERCAVVRLQGLLRVHVEQTDAVPCRQRCRRGRARGRRAGVSTAGARCAGGAALRLEPLEALRPCPRRCGACWRQVGRVLALGPVKEEEPLRRDELADVPVLQAAPLFHALLHVLHDVQRPPAPAPARRPPDRARGAPGGRPDAGHARARALACGRGQVCLAGTGGRLNLKQAKASRQRLDVRKSLTSNGACTLGLD